MAQLSARHQVQHVQKLDLARISCIHKLEVLPQQSDHDSYILLQEVLCPILRLVEMRVVGHIATSCEQDVRCWDYCVDWPLGGTCWCLIGIATQATKEC
jgi:hypothetical protein